MMVGCLHFLKSNLAAPHQVLPFLALCPHLSHPCHPQALFHQLLGSPCWAVQQAAMVSLVAYSRQHTGSITSLVPAGARTAAGNAVHPLFVQALASHMKQEPDAQVRVEVWAPALGVRACFVAVIYT